MTDAEITKLWEQSMDDAEGMRRGYTTQQHYFAALVAAAEREACAAACHEIMDEVLKDDGDYYSGVYCGADDCARKIRARGNEFSKDKVTK